MSQIFDALQRSHAERSGIDLSDLPGATELMESIEQQVALEWENAMLPRRPDAIESGKSDVVLGLDTVPARATAHVSRVAPVDELADKGLEIFSQIQSLHAPFPVPPGLACLADCASLGAEAFRVLKVRLQKIRQTRQFKSLLITSTVPQEGKSTVAANLACTLALKTEQRVLLLEGDMRRPSLSHTFGIEKMQGIREHLHDNRSLLKCICYLDGAGIWFLPAGSATNNPLELLQSGHLTLMMDNLRTWFDWIIIDSPPLLPLADTSVWMNLADGVILVARPGTTEKQQLKRGLKEIEPQKLIGAILNGSNDHPHSDYYYMSSIHSEDLRNN